MEKENLKIVLNANTVKEIAFEMIYVKGGIFWMGAQNTDPDEPNYNLKAEPDEYPIHRVTLDSYYISKFQVTQGLWKTVMGSNPSYFKKGDDYPVECVSYYDVQKFISELNQMTYKTFTLPTEAQWEFAARGGIKSKGYKYSGSNNIDDVAWHDEDLYKGSTHPVGQKQPNELGIYDMSGNVNEWCSDWYDWYDTHQDLPLSINPQGPITGSARIRRGGGWRYCANYCRVSYRSCNAAYNSSGDVGFRLVCYSLK